MATVIPFRGYTYNTEKIDNLGSVMAPPYDSITERGASEYYDNSEYNSIRITAPKEEDGKSTYDIAKEYLDKWIADEILVCDKNPAIYLYEQSVIVNNELRYNRGFLGLLELTDYSERQVTPCEEPSTDSKMDRFNILKTTKANASMISCMYVDKERRMKNIILHICQDTPDIEFKLDGVDQRVWKITDKSTISLITDFLAEQLIYIVDGHNRYEASLDYKKYRQSLPDYNADATYNYILAHFCESREGGKSQLPVHRLVKFKRAFREDGIISAMQDNFKVEKIIIDPTEESLAVTMRKQIATQRKETKFAIYCGGNYFYRLTLKDYEPMKLYYPDKTDVYRMLDITVLNKLVFEDVLNITDENMDERVSYTRQIEDGINAVAAGDCGCMFVLNPVKPAQISDVTLAGEKMPKRSVCVFPKPATGVVMHKFFE